MMRLCLGLLCLLYSVDNSNPGSCEDIENPSLGDLCLDSAESEPSKGVVLIYYTDNIEPPTWGTICDSLTDKTTTDVMCRQLGYESSNTEVSSAQSSEKVWFSSAQCSTSTQHILRCDLPPHTPSDACNSDENSVLQIECKGDWRQEPPDPPDYEGQVWLFPPNTTLPGQQISLGLVLIYIESSWGSISQDPTHPLSSSAADSICRQLGYTQADPRSITAMGNSALNFSLPGTAPNAWLKTSATNECQSSSKACFTCCYLSPTQECTLTECPKTADVVLQCLFDRHKDPVISSEGSGSLCSRSLSSNSPGSCAPVPYEALTISFGGAFGVTIVALILSLVFNGILFYKLRRRRRPEEQPLLRERPNNLDGNQN